MYKDVNELNENELEELRERYFYQVIDNGEEEYNAPYEIPISNVISFYEEISFVEEDFFCNIK
tara:strand:- start:31 stop:219 length:189 start_codon:yes stop_codon:yes gene_type:complete